MSLIVRRLAGTALPSSGRLIGGGVGTTTTSTSPMRLQVLPTRILGPRGFTSSKPRLEQPKTKVSSKTEFKSKLKSMWDKFLGPKPMPERWTLAWYGEMVLICTVFAIAGTSTMLIVRPAVKDVLHIDGSFRDGPWAYRICSIVIMSPLYAILLVGIGTVVGRHFYFKRFSIKIISRFGFPPETMDANWKANEKFFRKW